MRTLPSFKPQELSNLAYAFSFFCQRRKLGDRWLALLLDRSLLLMPDLSGRELANLAWSVSKIVQQQQPKSADLFRPHPLRAAGMDEAPLTSERDIADNDGEAADERTSSGSRASPSSAATAAFNHLQPPPDTTTTTSGSPRACAVATLASSTWMAAVLSAAQQRMHASDLSAQGVSCLLQACVSLQHLPEQALLRQLCLYSGQAHWVTDSAGPQALSGQLLSLAHLDHAPSDECMVRYEAAAMRCMAHEAEQQRGGLRPQHLANMLWGMAVVGWTPSPEFASLHLALTARLLPAFKPEELAQVLGALARLKLRVGRSLLELVCIQVGAEWGRSH